VIPPEPASYEAARHTEKSDIVMYNLPDERGHFGQFGGVFVAETLVHALDELREAYEKFQKDPEFVAEYERELKYFVGRPSPIYHAQRWSELLGGAQVFLKREDLNDTEVPTRSTT